MPLPLRIRVDEHVLKPLEIFRSLTDKGNRIPWDDAHTDIVHPFYKSSHIGKFGGSRFPVSAVCVTASGILRLPSVIQKKAAASEFLRQLRLGEQRLFIHVLVVTVPGGIHDLPGRFRHHGRFIARNSLPPFRRVRKRFIIRQGTGIHAYRYRILHPTVCLPGKQGYLHIVLCGFLHGDAFHSDGMKRVGQGDNGAVSIILRDQALHRRPCESAGFIQILEPVRIEGLDQVELWRPAVMNASGRNRDMNPHRRKYRLPLCAEGPGQKADAAFLPRFPYHRERLRHAFLPDFNCSFHHAAQWLFLLSCQFFSAFGRFNFSQHLQSSRQRYISVQYSRSKGSEGSTKR